MDENGHVACPPTRQMRVLPSASIAGATAPARMPPLVACDPGGGSAPDIEIPVLIGDGVSLVGYGVVQAVVDFILGPLARSQPELFTQTETLQSPVGQGAVVALVWILFGSLSGSYMPERVQKLPDALLACIVPWLGSSCGLLLFLALLAQAGIGPGASPAEVGFICGSGTIVGGWRLVYATAQPPE